MPPAPMTNFAASGRPTAADVWTFDSAKITDVIGSDLEDDFADLIEDFAKAGVERRHKVMTMFVKEILMIK
jgi:hypothetical protein